MKLDDCLRNQMNLSFDFSSDTAVKHRHCSIYFKNEAIDWLINSFVYVIVKMIGNG
jgi:hypothetical protein